jgi:hypothetical protein
MTAIIDTDMKKELSQERFDKFTWGVLAISILLPIIVWGNGISWRAGSISPYQWFPLFGLLAWMIMWTHYVTGAIRINNPKLKKPQYYSRLTGYIVLASLLLHPALLAYAQFERGAGIPPFSYIDYVGKELLLAVMMGSVALTIFLSFEIFNRLRQKFIIKKFWLAISFSQSIAMLLIFAHALKLGTHLTSGWFLIIWMLYGIVLLPCIYTIHRHEIASRAKTPS